MDNQDIARRLEAIIDTAIDGIITIDARGIIETVNQAACGLFGYNAHELLGHNVKVLMPEPDKSNHDKYVKKYVETRERHVIGIGRDVIGLKKNGDSFPLRLSVGEVILNDRIIFTGILHDLSELEAANNALEKANSILEEKVEERTTELEDTVNQLLSTNRELEESRHRLELSLEKEKELSELKSRFVSMASHEFRTPLSTILSSASIISRYTDIENQDKRTKHVDRIKSAVSNLTGILNDFLSISKLEEGVIDLKTQKIAVSDLLVEVKSELSGLLKSGQRIIINKNNADDRIITDPRILKNIFFNLISNAIKYSHEDSPINCVLNKEVRGLRVDIIDQGIGIPAEDQRHLFSRFFRANNVENIQGTGLGLAIVRQYVELLRGDIDFKSREGEGSTFTVIIPLQL